MKIFTTLILLPLLIGSLAHAGSTYRLFETPDRSEFEFCQDKFGMKLKVNGGNSQRMTRISFELYVSPDRAIKVERHTHDYGLDLVDEKNQRHVLIRSGGGFGSCEYRESEVLVRHMQLMVKQL